MAVGKLHKKASKRVTCRRRYKIERKVREHKRKVRKEQKQKERISGRPAKPEPVPNKCPFKADILREAEERKQRAEELRQKQKAERQKLIDKKRNLSSLVKDAEKRGKQFEATKALVVEGAAIESSKETDKSALVSLKAFYSEVKKVVELADVVLEVLDARDPIGSRCAVVEESVLNSGKRLVLLLNKIDLVPKANVEKWLKYLRQQLPTVAFKASTQEQQRGLGRAGHAFVATSKCIGADILMRLLGNYCRNKDIKTAIRVGVVGFPNVGKSSVINSLKRKVTCSVGATPGITRSVQEVHLDKHIRLLDSPGVVVATSAFDTVEMALKNAVRVETLEDPVPAIEAILRRCQKASLLLQYSVPDFEDAEEFLTLIARKHGRLRRGGVPDRKMAARKVLRDWNSGKLRYYTEPPEDEQAVAAYISSEVVAEMGKEFDLDAVEEDQRLLVEDLSSDPLTECDSIILAAQPFIPAQNNAQMEVEEESNEESDEESNEEVMEVDTGASATVKTDPPSRKSRAASPSPKQAPEMQLEGNQQVNRRLREDMKKKKKKGRRTDKIATGLSNALDQAVSSFNVGSSGDDDCYRFDDHFE